MLCQAFLGLWLVEGSQLWHTLHRPLWSCGVSATLGVSRLRLVTPRVYHIHHSFLGVYVIDRPQGSCGVLSHPDPTRLRLVRSGWLRLDSRPDCTFQQGVTNNTTWLSGQHHVEFWSLFLLFWSCFCCFFRLDTLAGFKGKAGTFYNEACHFEHSAACPCISLCFLRSAIYMRSSKQSCEYKLYIAIPSGHSAEI